MAQTPPDRAAQHRWRQAAEYLQLSPEQWARLRSTRAEHEQQMAQLSAQAKALNARRDAAALAELCQQSRRLHEGLQAALRGMLGPAQLERLARLDEAFSLMPIVESAQAAGLMADRLATSPAGLPQQQVSVEVGYARVEPPALPGCPGRRTAARPGTVDQRRDAPLDSEPAGPPGGPNPDGPAKGGPGR